METIYDVFRLLVAAGRGVLTAEQTAKAHAIIDRADPAVTTPEAPDA